MAERNTFYITTTLPYVNSKPHMGHALEFVQADVLARYHRLLGERVEFNVGTDEHGLKIYEKAVEAGEDPKAYADRMAEQFKALKATLNLSWTRFIRTTDPAHGRAAQEFWKRCQASGDIYQQQYQVRYCVGCELEKTDSELENGRCLLHPNLEIQSISELNYFFRFSKYQEQLLALYGQPDFVVPEGRRTEIAEFVRAGLKDFSISRLKDKLPWGVAVPGDDAQVMYVWFDALVNYISTLGWPAEGGDFKTFWPGVQIAGKDNLRQQSAMWQAMLMSAGVAPSKQIVIHGFVTSGGEKMSKTVGNVVDPLEIVQRFGTDAFRFWVCHEANTFEDSDFTWERFSDGYESRLVNGVGNLFSRVVKMATSYGVPPPSGDVPSVFGVNDAFNAALSAHRISEAARLVFEQAAELDREIQSKQPFKVFKEHPEQARGDVASLLLRLRELALRLQPFLPETAERMLAVLGSPSWPEQLPHLFERIEAA